jgi:hypothetical protein
VLSRAIVPPQNFGRRGAVIRIQVVEGYVDQVIWPVEKLTRYRDFFTDYSARITADRPANVRTLERYLLLANDLPGLKFSTTLKPSPTHPNASILIVEVKEKMIDTIARIDNRGTRARALAVSRLGHVQQHRGLARGVHRDLCGHVPARGTAILQATTGRCSTARADVLRQCELRHRHAGHRSCCVARLPHALRIAEAASTYPVIRTRETQPDLTGLGFITDDQLRSRPAVHARQAARLPLKADADWADSFLGINQVNVTFSQGIKGSARATAAPACAAAAWPAVDQCGRVDFSKIEARSAGCSRCCRILGFRRGLRPIRLHAAAGLGAMLYGGRFFGRAFDPRRCSATIAGPRSANCATTSRRRGSSSRAAGLRLRGPRRGLQHQPGAGHAAVAERHLGRRRRARRVGRHLHGRPFGREGGRRAARRLARLRHLGAKY